MMQAGDLRCKIDIYRPGQSQNELGEDTLEGLEIVAESIPAQIIPAQGANLQGANRDMLGGLDTTQVTHKIRIRAEKRGYLTPDTVIIFNGQRYDVRYWQPVYNNQRLVEILTVMEVSI